MIEPGVRRHDGWLLFDAPLPELGRGRGGDFARTLLSWSAQLPGGCKFALLPGAAGLCLRAELPGPGESEAQAAQVAAVYAGFAAAAELLGGV